jgi:hypothetical protein
MHVLVDEPGEDQLSRRVDVLQLGEDRFGPSYRRRDSLDLSVDHQKILNAQVFGPVEMTALNKGYHCNLRSAGREVEKKHRTSDILTAHYWDEDCGRNILSWFRACQEIKKPGSEGEKEGGRKDSGIDQAQAGLLQFLIGIFSEKRNMK